MIRRILQIVAAVAVLIGCGDSSSGNAPTTNGSAKDGGRAKEGGGTKDAGGASAASSGSVTGSVNGKSFTRAMTALYAGKPDDPASTLVYVFEASVECSQISATGWDKRIMNGSQVLEMKMLGKTPMTYTVTTSATPAPGEASVNHTVASATGAPPETSSSGGSVTLDAITPKLSASGSYDLKYPDGSLTGTFHATYCAGGVEP